MKLDLINPFVKASQDVLETFANVSCKMGKVYKRQNTFYGSDVMIFIGLTGQLRGQAIIGMDLEISKKIISNMLGGLEVVELNELGKSAISEMGNMILGNAATHLSKNGIAIDITPPTLMIARELSITTPVEEMITIPLSTEYGIIELDIGIKE